MNLWTIDELKHVVINGEFMNEGGADNFLEYMNANFPPHVFNAHLEKRRRALKNAELSKETLIGAKLNFPQTINYQSIKSSFEYLRNFAIVFTAGGDGERLRLSLLERGASEDNLRNFTKATYPIKIFYKDYGALQINLSAVSYICRKYNFNIPVIVTTGSKESLTYKVICDILEKHKNFNLAHLKIIPQDDRLHFTQDEKIAVTFDGNKNPRPVTQPDETGGPLMKLKEQMENENQTALQYLSNLNCEKLLIVQGTALYDLRMLTLMASAAKNHDCVGVGIARKTFDAKDPFGTFVTATKNNSQKTFIVEQGQRSSEFFEICHPQTKEYLPFNTGFYALDRAMLENNTLPDYATPPKEVLPNLPKSPKVGYAATDIFPLSKNPVILTVSQDMYSVIKTADDLETMSEIAKNFGLLKMM